MKNFLKKLKKSNKIGLSIQSYPFHLLLNGYVLLRELALPVSVCRSAIASQTILFIFINNQYLLLYPQPPFCLIPGFLFPAGIQSAAVKQYIGLL